MTGTASLALLDEQPAHPRRGGPPVARWSPTAWSTPSRRSSTASARPTRSSSACAARVWRRTRPAWPTGADDGVVVHREDGLGPDQLRDLAQAVAAPRGPGGGRGRLPRRGQGGVAVASGDDAVDAGVTAKELAQLVGGRGRRLGRAGRGRRIRPRRRSTACWPRPDAGSALTRCGWPEPRAGGGGRPRRAPHRRGRLRRHRDPGVPAVHHRAQRGRRRDAGRRWRPWSRRWGPTHVVVGLPAQPRRSARPGRPGGPGRGGRAGPACWRPAG